jgi:hypothetical protein
VRLGKCNLLLLSVRLINRLYLLPGAYHYVDALKFLISRITPVKQEEFQRYPTGSRQSRFIAAHGKELQICTLIGAAFNR